MNARKFYQLDNIREKGKEKWMFPFNVRNIFEVFFLPSRESSWLEAFWLFTLIPGVNPEL
jgi:hypothetical protein